MRPADRVRIVARLLTAAVVLAVVFAARVARADGAADDPSPDGGMFTGGGSGGPRALSGAMNYSVPFDLPRARGAAQPRLAISYDSGTTDREAGYGWGLAVPAITRTRLSGRLHFDETDRFNYAGNTLVYVCTVGFAGCPANEPIDSAWLAGWRYYRVQVEGEYARFFWDGQLTWLIQRQSGVMDELGLPMTEPTLFGSAMASAGLDLQAGDPNRAARFKLVRQVDVHQNIVAYNWRQTQFGLSQLEEIVDTYRPGDMSPGEFAHHTTLRWEPHPFRVTGYGPVERLAPRNRLKEVIVASKTWVAGGEREVLRGWKLHYYENRNVTAYDATSQAPLVHHSFLKDVVQFGCGAASPVFESGGAPPGILECPTLPSSWPTLKFTYQPGSFAPTLPHPAYNLQATSDVAPPFEVVTSGVMDLDLDGVPDVVRAWRGGQIAGVGRNIDVLTTRHDQYHHIGHASLSVATPDAPPTYAARCIEAGRKYTATTEDLASLAARNGHDQPRFFSQAAGHTMRGAFGDSLALWGTTGFCPVRVSQLLAPSPFIDGGCFDVAGASVNPRWRWEPATAGAEPTFVKCSALPPPAATAHLWSTDADGDGLVDLLEGTSDTYRWLEQSNVRYSARHPRVSTTFAHLKPFSEVGTLGPFGLALATIQPKTPTSGVFPEHAARSWFADINGDGIGDLVQMEAFREHLDRRLGGPKAPPEIRPGDGWGRYGCSLPSTMYGAAETAPGGCVDAPADAPAWVTSTISVDFQGPLTPWRATAPQEGWGVDTFFRDVTGDGLADVVQLEIGDGTGRVRLWVNEDGHTFRCARAAAADECVVGTLSVDTDPYNPKVVSFADMNANGVDDVVVTDKLGHVWYLDVYAAGIPVDAPRPGLLTKIESGFGATTLVHYRSLQHLDQEAAAAGSPWTYHSPIVAAVVDRIWTESDQTSFEYRDPAFDPWERRFAGFRTVRTKRAGEAAVTETQFWFSGCQREHIVNSDCPLTSDDEEAKALVAKVVRVDRFVPAVGATPAKWLSAQRFNYAYGPVTQLAHPDDLRVHAAPATVSEGFVYDPAFPITSQGAAVPLAGGDAVAPAPEQTGRRLTLRREATFDRQFGYATQTVDRGRNSASAGLPQVTIPADEPVTTTYSRVVLPNWRVVPVSVTTTGGGLKWPREQQVEHDALGEIIAVDAKLYGSEGLDRGYKDPGMTVAPSPAPGVNGVWHRMATLTRDAYGNVVRTEGPGSIAGPGACSEVDFDEQYVQFPAFTREFVDGCGGTAFQTIHVHDRGREVEVLTTDATGASGEVTLDAFGRVATIKEPTPETYGTDVTTTISHLDVPNPRVFTRSTVGPGKYKDHVTIYNGLGQPLASLESADTTAGDAAPWVVTQHLRYSWGNRVDASRRPYFWSGDPLTAVPLFGVSPDVTIARDDFGRDTAVMEIPQSVSLPIRTLVSRTYKPLEVITRDAEQVTGGPYEGGYTRVSFDGFGRARERFQTTKDGITLRENLDYVSSLPGVEAHRVSRWSGTGTLINQRWVYFDSFGRVTYQTEPNTNVVVGGVTHTWRYVWDDAGRLIGTSDPRGCGKNLSYDGLGRLLAEDWSPCEAHHAAYTAEPEVTYKYDAYEPDQVQSTPDFVDDPDFAKTRLVSVTDRGSHTRVSYDVRGRPRRTQRRLAAPDGSGYTGHWFTTETKLDLGDRVTEQTTGAEDPALLGMDGKSRIWLTYSGRGAVRQIDSSFGTLVTNIKYDAEGHNLERTYGDAAGTRAVMTYDGFGRPSTYDLTRASAPPVWSQSGPNYTPPGTGTTQLELERLFVAQYDRVDNPTDIQSLASSSQWGADAQPVRRQIQYDGFYRAKRVDYSYLGAATQTNPFQHERLAGDSRPVPLRNPTQRVTWQTMTYDAIGNLTASNDNAALRYDRSLGTTTFATGTNRMTAASGVSATYDEAGNMIGLRVSRATTSCGYGATAACGQLYRFDWDEVGQLARSRRWDYAQTVPAGEPAVPGATPVWDLSYEYSGGQRVRKTWTAYGSTRHTLDVFGSLRLKDVGYDPESSEYERDASQTHVFLAGGARMIYDPALPQPGATPNGQHVLLRMGDMLGSTSVVVDKESSEVVERATYLAHGAIESDYRPERWGASREDQKYTGHEEDVEVGLVYAGARYYQPHLGVWLSPDPLVIAGGGGEMNPYSYIGGRVFQGTDPTGLEYNPEVAHPSHGVPHAGHVDFGEFPQQSVDGGEPLVRILPKPAARTAPSSTSTKSTYPSVPDVSTDPNPAPREESSQGKPLSAAQLARLAGESMLRGTAHGKAFTAVEHIANDGFDLGGVASGFARAWIENDVGLLQSGASQLTGGALAPAVNHFGGPEATATAVLGPGGGGSEELGKLLASPSIMVGQAGLILLSMGGGGSATTSATASRVGAAGEETVTLFHGSKSWSGRVFDLAKAIAGKQRGTPKAGIYLTDDALRAAQYGRGGKLVVTRVPASFARRILRIGFTGKPEYYVNTEADVAILNQNVQVFDTSQFLRTWQF
jgi:RHS repeat-associated protein